MPPSPARVATRHLKSYRLDLSEYDSATVPAQEIINRISVYGNTLTLHGEESEYQITPSGHFNSLDEDVGKSKSGKAAILNRAWLWPLDRFSAWLEQYAGSGRIDQLRQTIEASPLLILIKNPKGKVVGKRPGTEEDLRQMQELSKDEGYSSVRGMTIEAEPLNRGPLGKKLRELEEARDQRLQDYASLYKRLQNPEVSFEVSSHRPDSIMPTLYANGVVVGGMQAVKMGVASDGKEVVNPLCTEDLATLSAKYGDGPVWMVFHAIIHPFLRGKGYGVKLYGETIEAIKRGPKPAYLVANRCYTAAGGDLTTDEAKRVWAHLVKRYPSSGYTIALV